MKQEHGPIGVRLNNLGANTSDELINVGASEKGYYLDSNNFRLRSFDGNDGDLEQIKGEVLLYDNVEAGIWTCIGTENVKNRKVEFWAENSAAQDPIIIIDGIKVAQSPNIPFISLKPLQIDKNEGCEEGEIFVSDHNTAPLIFDIQDMLSNVGGDKYFAGFNYDLYTVNLNKPLDVPVFMELVNLDGTGGLPVGSYQYAIAYVTKSGDRTSLSEKTPPIPVVRNLSFATRVFPAVKTYGDDPNINSNTVYGPKIRFRITNTLNYDSIEIIRFDYNIGAGIDFTPVAKVVGRVQLFDGQIGFYDFIDPKDSDRSITLSVEEETQKLYLIEKAKGIRYYGSRLTLANVSLVEKIDTSTFKISSGGNKIFPILEKIGVNGHNDPSSHAYRSSNMGGEKDTIGINFYDAVGATTFVKEDEDLSNVQFPNRRDIMDSESQGYSYSGFPTMANKDGGVTPVFESFDHANAVSKGDLDNFKNILKKGSRSTATVVSALQPSDPDDHQASGGFLGTTTKAPYLPFRPVNKNELADSHAFLPNIKVDTDGFFGAGSKYDYDPTCFGLDYYSKGYALAGLENIPDWVKSFSVVRTESAGRVVLQGLGMYKISPGSYSGSSSSKITKKDNDSCWFFSPDIDSGLVSQSQIDEIKQNPSSYAIQFVSPLGFFSETYSFESNAFKDHLVDMMTYARIQRDLGDINPGNDPTTGAGGYVYYNKFRGETLPKYDINGGFFSGSDGNKEMGIEFMNEIKEGKGSYFNLGFSSNFYETKTVGGTGKRDFDDTGLKDWTEPFYMINIIKTGAEIQEKDIQGYKSTGTHIKLDSIIGLGNGTDLTQEFNVIDERWEDCCHELLVDPTDRYLYLRSTVDQTERVFYDSTNASLALIAIILADISGSGFWVSPLGYEVVGIYTHSKVDNQYRRNQDFVINFDVTGFYPTADEYVVVKYDNRIPIRFFGGDTYVGETIFAPIDRNTILSGNSDDPEDSDQFVLNVGFPYGRYKMNPRYYRTKNTTAINKIQDTDWHSFSHLREMCVMFTCEARTAIHLAHNTDNSPDEFYPLTHYVMRPNVWDADETLRDNNIYEEYEDDYPGEFPNRFEYGGIRFKQTYNLDYSTRGRIEFFSKPKIGYEEKFDFCNLVIWSLPRFTNQQDSPGLKTFLVQNSIEIEDAQGEIKFLYAATFSDKGSNLYAISERGVCLLLTNKSILSNINSNFLTSVATDGFISQEYWLNREKGSDGQFWRGKAEGVTSTPSEAGDLELEFLIFPNRESVFTLINNQVRNVGNKQYSNTLRPALENHSLDYSQKMTGAYDEKHNEYYLDIDNGTTIPDRINFKFYLRSFQWVGTQDYEFDRYLYSKGEMYGLRGLQTFTLNQGYEINGVTIESWLKQSFAQQPKLGKEFIRIGVGTGGRGSTKPTKIQFLDVDDNVIGEMSEALLGPNWLLHYDSWEQFIPRRSDNGDRIQNQMLIYKIFHNLAEDFKIVDTTVQYKILK